MKKRASDKVWCGAAYYLIVILSLTGCAGGTQRNMPSGTPAAEQGTENQQPAESQQSAESQQFAESQQSAESQQLAESQQSAESQQFAESQQSAENQPPVLQSVESQQPENEGIDLEKAKSIALQNAGVEAESVVFTKTELDYDNGVAEYEIEFVTGSTKYEYEISVASGAILKFSQEAVDQSPSGASTQGVISVEDAKSIALNYAQFTAEQVVYTKAELDYDDGRAEYEIEFYADGKEYSLTIDAVSGTVLEMELD